MMAIVAGTVAATLSMSAALDAGEANPMTVNTYAHTGSGSLGHHLKAQLAYRIDQGSRDSAPITNETRHRLMMQVQIWL